MRTFAGSRHVGAHKGIPRTARSTDASNTCIGQISTNKQSARSTVRYFVSRTPFIPPSDDQICLLWAGLKEPVAGGSLGAVAGVSTE